MLTRKELLDILRESYSRRTVNREKIWENIARENQKIPIGDWNIWLIMAGRGFGKTRAAAEAVRKLVLEGKYKRIALIGGSMTEVRNVMIEGDSGLLAISNEKDGLMYHKSSGQLMWPNGAIATIYSAEFYDKLRGPQFDFAWLDEVAKFSNPDALFNQLNLALRLGNKPRIIMTTTPRPIKFLKDLIKRKDVFVTRGASIENKSNLSQNFLQQLEYMKGTALEAQELYGEIIEENEHGLWTFDDISNCYKTTDCDFTKIIISVDPSVNSDGIHDETGIVVCALDELNEAYVMADLSLNAPPDKWSKKVAEAYQKYAADYVLFEANQGGDLTKSLLKKINPDIRVKSVRATKSKKARALPVYDLYIKKRVHHLKQFRNLEMQMLAFDPKRKSPDRVDALVWGVTDLLITKSKRKVPTVWKAEM